jgi:hypothetical protein
MLIAYFFRAGPGKNYGCSKYTYMSQANSVITSVRFKLVLLGGYIGVYLKLEYHSHPSLTLA